MDLEESIEFQIKMTRKRFSRVYIVIGFFTGLLIKWQLFKTITINTLLDQPMALLVREKYDIVVSNENPLKLCIQHLGRILTQKTTCFLCENEKYGKKWRWFIEEENCQNAMFERCFRNFTKHRRRTTKVASIVRRCRFDDCECNNLESRDWCVTSTCGVNLVCCEEKFLRCSRTYNHWFYMYFRTSSYNLR